MNRFQALEEVKGAWLDAQMPLGERVTAICDAYYGSSLDLVGTATYIGSTPAELSVMLTLGGKSDEVIEALSRANPPITACTVLAEATEEDIIRALKGYSSEARRKSGLMSGEFVYNSIIEVVGPTVEMKVASLSGSDIAAARKKGKAYGKLNDWADKFLGNIAARRRSGQQLTDKQTKKLEETLRNLCNEQVFTRNSLDKDQELCDRILDALE